MFIAGILGIVFSGIVVILSGIGCYKAFASISNSVDLMDLIWKPILGGISGLICIMFVDVLISQFDVTIASITFKGTALTIVFTILFMIFLYMVYSIRKTHAKKRSKQSSQIQKKVTLNCTVTLVNLQNGNEKSLKVIRDKDLDVNDFIYPDREDSATDRSPMGKALLGNKAGTKIRFKGHSGEQFNYLIKEIKKNSKL